MSFLIPSAADQTVADRLISAPRSINFCPPEVSVFIFPNVAERTRWAEVLKLYHTPHVCLQKVCGAILINATSPQCYISARTQSAFSILKHCTRENAFDTNDIVISHTACLPAKGLQRNSHQCYVSSRLHLLTGSVRVLVFWNIAQERTLSTQVL